MLLILSGPSCVGKSFTVEYLRTRHGFNTVCPYTSRSPRPTEAEGIHYHFRSRDEIRKISRNLSDGYWATPLGDEIYGYMSEVESCIDEPSNWVIQAYSDIALDIKKNNNQAITVFLDFKTDAEMKDRLNSRFGHSEEDTAARLDHAGHERSRRKEFDHCIEEDSHEAIAQIVSELALRRSVESAPDGRSALGFMSDRQLSSSLADPHGLAIFGIDKDRLQERISGCTIDLTLSPRYYRVRQKWRMGQVVDLAKYREDDVTRLFVEKNAGDRGITLGPGEMILAGTVEKIRLPHNIIGFVSGRSSYSRMGISVTLNQDVIHPGHSDVIPLQIVNHLRVPIILYPNTSIIQVAFFTLAEECEIPYSMAPKSKYAGSLQDIRSRFYQDDIYKEIPSILEWYERTNWVPFLNGALAVTIFMYLTFYLLTLITTGDALEAFQYAQIIAFCCSALIGIMRLIGWMKNPSN